jgi:hypothetical protein
MSLSDRINDKFEQWRQDFTRGVAGLLVTIVGRGIELVMDIVGKAMKPALMPAIDRLLAQPDLPDDVKHILTQIKTTDGQWQSFILGGMGGTIIGGSAGAALFPQLEILKQVMSKGRPFQIFDFPIVLAALLRDDNKYGKLVDDLLRRGYDDFHIEALRELVHVRLDPLTVQQIWLRDKEAYNGLWWDLYQQGWDLERINVFKELAMLIPGAADLIRMAVREVFTPEIAAKYGQFEDFPPDFARWGEKIGLTAEWAKNYWAAHWDLPSASQGFELLHRGIITYDELKVLLRALDVMPFWRDKLIQIAYSPYTRVDVRRMYKEGVVDEAGVKRTYLDLGYDDEHAQALTEFTIKTYGRDEDKVADEEEKIRDLTRADICDGYNRGVFTAAEASDLLAKLAYTTESIKFYLDREDLKKDQALKDAYATNYRQLFVIGLRDADSVKSEMVELGFLGGEVDEYLKLWYVEKLRRQAKPSRTDLARFLKKEIITEDTWRQSMADLGYADKYIDWYRADMEE